MKITKFTFYQLTAILVILLHTGFCFGWAENWADLKTAAGRIGSVRAKFVQEKHMKMLVRPLVSSGLLCYQAPDSLRWEYLHPIQSILVTHKGETKKYIRKDGKTIEDAAAGSQSMQFVVAEITRWLKGRFDENPAFEATLGAGRKIVLTPRYKGLAAMIQRIVLTLSERPGIMESVVIYESADSYTVLKFSDVTLNERLPVSLFEVAP